MDYADAYNDMRDGGTGGNGDASTPGPTGIPDPNNPGYDTNGYPLSETPRSRTPGPATTQGPGSAPPAPPQTPDPAPDPGLSLNLSDGPLANFDEAAPQLAPIPAFQRRADFAPTTFAAPTMEAALNDPGYKFRVQQGRESLQNWAAARGTLNDTDTGKMLEDYGQNAAEQGYGNVYARDFGTWQGNETDRFGAWSANEGADERTYDMNKRSQYVDPFEAAYKAWVQRGNWYLNNQGTVANTAVGLAQLS